MTALEPKHTTINHDKIGILAGAGSVPREIADAAISTGRDVHVIALRDIADADFSGVPHTVIGLGQVGAMLRALRANRCRQFIMSGSLQRPSLWSLAPDLGFFLNLGTIIGLTRGGDDTILRKILDFFKANGMEPVGIPDVAPSLLATTGPLSYVPATSETRSDTKIAFRLIGRLSAFDVGQAVVVRDGQVVGIEAAEGTDGLLRKLSQQVDARGGILVKATKPTQDLRADLPTIGPRTVQAAAAIGLGAIVVEAGRSVIAQRQATVAEANLHEICILGMIRDQAGDNPDHARASRHSYRNGRKDDAQGSGSDTQTAARALREIMDFQTTAAVCVSRQRVLSVALGKRVSEIIEDASLIKQWGNRRGKHRGAAIAISDAKHISADLVTQAADMGVREIGYYRSDYTKQVEELKDQARQRGMEILDLNKCRNSPSSS